MIGEGRYCMDVVAQLRAIQSAARAIEANVLRTHLAACVKDAMTSGTEEALDDKIEELMRVFKRLD